MLTLVKSNTNYSHKHYSVSFFASPVLSLHETMIEDVQYILDEIGESNVTFPSSSHFKPSETATKYKTKEQYLSSVSLETLNKIFKLYDRDYDLFGYSQTLLHA